MSSRKKILLCGFQNSAQMISRVASFFERRALQPVGWAARTQWRSAILEAAPRVPFFQYPLPKPARPRAESRLDESSARFSPIEEENMLYMLDRDFRSPNHLHARQLSYLVIDHAQAVLTRAAPDLVVFSDVPHDVFSYVLYLCSKKEGIQTAIIKVGCVPHLYYWFSSIEEGTAAIVADYKAMLDCGVDGNRVSLSETSEAYLSAVKRRYDDAIPQYMRRQQQEHGTWKKRIRRALTVPGRVFTNRPLAKAVAMARRDLLRRSYEKLCVDQIDRSSPYIAVFLHLQPERSTMPEGGIFAHQWMMVTMLARALPAGWTLYVREHPSTFWPGPKLVRGRWFYEAMARYPAVRLVSLKEDPFELTDRARAVATVTGTVGFEAVIRGIPALVFGAASYAGCEGVFLVRGMSDCLEAVRRLEGGVEIDQAKVRLFVSACERSPSTYVSSYRLGADPLEFLHTGEAHEALLGTIVDAEPAQAVSP